MILVFDLDDTLYEEIAYVKSSFEAVAAYLSNKFELNKSEIYAKLLQVLEEQGRGAVFNEVLMEYNLYSKEEVKKCLSVYRKNRPNIKLTKEAEDCLARFSSYPKYLVTDGNKLVQSLKIKALKLEGHFKKCIPTHNFGKKHSKPSTYIFHKIVQWENADPRQLVYIGDNPNKDFVNLKKDGFKTVRVLTGMFKDLEREKEYEADYTINSLDKLSLGFIKKIFEEKER